MGNLRTDQDLDMRFVLFGSLALILSVDDLLSVDGIGEKLAESFVAYFSDAKNQDLLQKLSNILTINLPEKILSNASFDGKTFVITGSLTHFANRNECKEKIGRAHV